MYPVTQPNPQGFSITSVVKERHQAISGLTGQKPDYVLLLLKATDKI